MQLDVILVLMVAGPALGFSLGWGRQPERIGALLLLSEIVIVRLHVLTMGRMDFSAVSIPLVAIDACMLAGFLWLATRSVRIWPIFAAGFEVIALSGHFAIWVSDEGMQRAYWAMTQLPLILELVVLTMGTFLVCRARNRGVQLHDWRLPTADLPRRPDGGNG